MNRKKIEKMVSVNSVSVSKRILAFTFTLTAYCLLPTAYCFGWSSPVIIDSGSSNAYRTDIAFDSRGNAIAVFEQKSGDVYRIFASRYINGKGWESATAIDSGIGNGYRAQVAFDKEGNAIAVFKQEIGNGRYRIFANYYKNPYTDTDTHTATNIGWQGAVPIDNGVGNVDGQDIVFDSKGNAAVVFEAKDGEEMGIYVNFYSPNPPQSPFIKGGDRGILGGWSGAFRIDSGSDNAFFPYPIFDDKGNLYVLYYKEESGGLEVYVSRLQKPEARSQKPEVISQKITYGNIIHKKEDWLEKKSEVSRGIKAVYNPIFLDEMKKRIYSGNYSYSRWETPSKLDSRFRDAYRPTLFINEKGELTALFVRWDGEYLSAYAADYRNGSWGKPLEIDAGNGNVEHIRGAINSRGEMAIVWTQWQSESQRENLRIHARLYNSHFGWGKPEIIDAGKKDGYNPSVVFTESGEIVAVWCQWEKANVKSYINIYRKGIGWGRAERLENKEGETCGVRIAAGPDGKVIAIFEQEGFQGHQSTSHQSSAKSINRIFAVSFIQDAIDKMQEAIDGGEYTIRRLTDGNKEDYYAEFSPDGAKIIFVRKQGSSTNLYIMDADGKNMKQLTSGNTADTSPVWTPDGERIIFASNRVKEGWDIWSVKPDGSDLARLTKWSRNEYSPHPTSDGKNILYISTAGGDHSVWIMDMNGENERRLTSGGTGDWFPAMNPDGKEIVFVSTRLGNGDIWTIDSAEKRYHRLTYTDLPEFSPAWSPDGSRVAYVTNQGGEFDVWIMDRDGKNKRRLTKGLSDKNWGNRFSAIKIMETAGYYHLSWHPDGTKLLFTEWETDTNTNQEKTYISVLEFDKGILDKIEVDRTPIPEWTLIGEKELTVGEWEDFGPAFSPDGGSIAFSSNRSGSWDIWSMEFNGENLRQLTKGDDDELAPVYSPDGKEIAFLRSQKPEARSQKDETNFENLQSSIVNRQYSLWIMKSGGSGARQITKGIPIISYPAWHPNGRKIAFVVREEDGTNIWSYDLENSKIRKLAVPLLYKEGRGEVEIGSTPPDLPLQRGGMRFSMPLYRIGYNPAGDKITFESNSSGNIEIWTMRADGTNLARITEGDSPHWNPIWSPDGKFIAYSTEKLGEEAGHHNWRNYNIWVANTETHEERIITGEEQTDWNPVWSPDGKKIAYVTNRADGFKHFGIWMLYLK